MAKDWLRGLLANALENVTRGNPSRAREFEEVDIDDDELDDAVDEYEAFHWGNEPDSIETVEIPDPPKALVKIGALEGVIYRTAKGQRKQESWVHFHDEREPPILAYDPKTGQLYILGGKYRITPHGIED